MEIVKDIFKRSFGWIAGILKVRYYAYQVLPFLQVIKGKTNYKETPVLYTLICFFNCLFWHDYGDFIHSLEIRIWFLINTYLFFALIAIYLIYERKEYSEDALFNAIIFIAGSWVLSLRLSLFSIRKIEMILTSSTIAEYYFLIKFIYRAIKEKNYNSIKINQIKFNLFSCLFWVIYGIFFKTYIIYPNLIGIIVSSTLICFILKHRKNFPSLKENENNSTVEGKKVEMDESKIEIKIDEMNPIKIINRLRNKRKSNINKDSYN